MLLLGQHAVHIFLVCNLVQVAGLRAGALVSAWLLPVSSPVVVAALSKSMLRVAACYLPDRKLLRRRGPLPGHTEVPLANQERVPPIDLGCCCCSATVIVIAMAIVVLICLLLYVCWHC